MKLSSVIALLLNLIIIFGNTASLIHDMRLKDETGIAHPKMVFRYFTTLSNIYAMLGALLAICLLPSGKAFPGWAMAIIYSSSVSVAVTFLTVMVFLGPLAGYKPLVTHGGFHLHVLSPVLAVLNLCLLEKAPVLSYRQLFSGVAPVILYSALYLYMVILRGEEKGGWEDFYGFNLGGKWKLSMVLMYSGTSVLSLILLVLHNL